MTVQIEKGIPAPAKPTRNDFPFDKMEVGDSFLVDINGRASWGFLFAAIQIAQNKHTIKLTSREVEEGKRRVWRVA